MNGKKVSAKRPGKNVRSANESDWINESEHKK